MEMRRQHSCQSILNIHLTYTMFRSVYKAKPIYFAFPVSLAIRFVVLAAIRQRLFWLMNQSQHSVTSNE